MSNLIPAEESALRTWLEHLASRIATSGVGVALLDAQITDLEKKCADLRDRQINSPFSAQDTTSDPVSSLSACAGEQREKMVA